MRAELRKPIKSSPELRQVIARFEAERQALALMDHPNIARVFDAGTTPQGRPYFVMELVKGLPITEYCREANLDVRERIALMRLVCSAVQHAHHKLRPHRECQRQRGGAGHRARARGAGRRAQVMEAPRTRGTGQPSARRASRSATAATGQSQRP